MKRILSLLALLLTLAIPASAQVVTAPIAASFSQPDADFAASLSFTFEFFQCQPPPAPPGTGCATSPFQAGASIPKSAVSTLAPPDSFGNNRQFSFTSAILPATPLGVSFVGTLLAVGDPLQGAGNSARSAASNPFFLGSRMLVPVGTVRTK